MRTYTLRRFNREARTIREPVYLTLGTQLLGTFTPAPAEGVVQQAKATVSAPPRRRRKEPA
jgi:hypothetical protein